MSANPFLVETDKPLVAISGLRNGYLQIAPASETTTYRELPHQPLFEAVHQWAICLENLGAKRVYWMTLSEMVPHLHIHLYPRWSDAEELRGVALFESRTSSPQPSWTQEVEDARQQWAQQYGVHLI